MPTLNDVLARKREKIARWKSERSAAVLLEGPAQDHAKISFMEAVRRNPSTRNVVIAEFKRSSLSWDFVDPEEDPSARFETYQEAGASAISVLTDEDFFHGDFDDVETAKRCVDLPVLMKDFVIDEYQIYRGLSAGADFILLIVRLLTDEELNRMMKVVRRLGMEALVEVCSDGDLERALKFSPELIGVNSRDLDTLKVDTGLFERIGGRLPAGAIKVAESGIRSPADIVRLRGLGYDGFLVGEALMSSADPETLLKSLVKAGFED